jgi:putative colanic acid biosynthesis acetyltransferase WcaF
MTTDSSQGRVDLSRYDNSWYHPGASPLKRALWYFVNAWFLNSYLIPYSSLKVRLLRFFGARIGRGVTVKPCVNVKHPWMLRVGDHSWIGEGVWIDNLALVDIGSHACLSQGAMLLTGNHDYKKPGFDLMVAGIVLGDGVWIGARAMVCPGVSAGAHSVLTATSTATSSLEPYGIYSGNPALRVRERRLT